MQTSATYSPPPSPPITSPKQFSNRNIIQQNKVSCFQNFVQKHQPILKITTSISLYYDRNYYKYSYHIMKIINPNFQHQYTLPSSSQFLSQFINLYLQFFQLYSLQFQFKIKLKNLLRPNNFNLIYDLIKYLANFSKDYAQYLQFWYFNHHHKKQQITKQNHNKLTSLTSTNFNSFTRNQSNNSGKKQKQKPSINLQKIPLNFKKYQYLNDIQSPSKPPFYKQNYGILNLQPITIFLFAHKFQFNQQMLRVRMNQMYCNSKFRNSTIRNAINLYSTTYNTKFHPQSPTPIKQINLIQDPNPHITHPFTISLTIHKTGYSCINVTYSQTSQSSKHQNLSTTKNKIRCSSLNIKQSGLFNSQQLIRSQSKQSNNNSNSFMLKSLKVLRASQNIFPTLNNKTRNLPQPYSKSYIHQFQQNILHLPTPKKPKSIKQKYNEYYHISKNKKFLNKSKYLYIYKNYTQNLNKSPQYHHRNNNKITLIQWANQTNHANNRNISHHFQIQ